MIFLTVGTSLLQFDRLVKGMDIAVRDGLIDEDVYAQIGVSKYKPKYMQYHSAQHNSPVALPHQHHVKLWLLFQVDS